MRVWKRTSLDTNLIFKLSSRTFKSWETILAILARPSGVHLLIGSYAVC